MTKAIVRCVVAATAHAQPRIIAFAPVRDAIREATKLRDWCVEVDPDYLKFNISTLDSLLQELASEIERLQAGFDGQDQG